MFSAIWSPSISAQNDELFSNESRYTFFYRTQTNVSVIIGQSLFYVSNVQQPIARQTEIIFHNFLFTIVVLELFGLLFLLVKLLLVPLFNATIIRLHDYLSRKNRVNEGDELAMVVVNKVYPSEVAKQIDRCDTRRRSSTVIDKSDCCE